MNALARFLRWLADKLDAARSGVTIGDVVSHRNFARGVVVGNCCGSLIVWVDGQDHICSKEALVRIR